MTWQNYSVVSRWFVVLVALLALLAIPVAAQVSNGGLTGTVTDPSGAIIIGAQVTLTNVNTGAVRTAKTSASGLYAFNELPVTGTYKLEVSFEGFKTAVHTGIKVTVGTVTRSDVIMEVGARAEVVTVEAAPPVIDTTDAHLSTIVEGSQIANLPLNGRNVYNLITLAPGAADATNVSFESAERGSTTVVNGTRPNFQGFLLNGVSNKGLSGGANTLVNPDIIAEFQQLTLNDSAQYGNSAGSINNLVTKSGTNEFHGSMYYFHRNEALDANNFVLNQFGEAKPPLNFNQFGVTATGPVIKDKLFFTASYQGERFITSSTPSSADVESPEWRNLISGAAFAGAFPNLVSSLLYGDFPNTGAETPGLTLAEYIAGGASATGFTTFAQYLCPDLVRGYASIANQFQQLFGVTAADIAAMSSATFGGFGPDGVKGTADDGPCSVIPAAPFASAVAGFSRDMPFTVSTPVLFPQRSQGNLLQGNEWSTRLDWQANQNNRLFGEFYWFKQNDEFGPGLFSSKRGFSNPLTNKTPNFQTSWVSTIKPTVVNELRAGFSRLNYVIDAGFPGVPSISFGDGSIGFGAYNGYPQVFVENVYTYSDMLSINKGSHNFKMGAEFRRNLENSDFDVARPSYYFLDPLMFALDNPDFEVAGVDPGIVSGSSPRLSSNNRAWRNLEMGFFFQDDWKVNRKLTLNLGIRYDLYTRHTEKFHRVTTFILPPGTGIVDEIRSANIPAGDPGCDTPEQEALAQLAGVCGPGGFAVAGQLGQGDHNNWGPRFGVAWDPWGTGKTAIRAGFGISYEGTLYNPLSNSRWNLPFYSFNEADADINGTGNPIVYGFDSNCDGVIDGPPSFTGDSNNCGIGVTGSPEGTGNIQGWSPFAPNLAFLTGIVFPSGIRDPWIMNAHVGFQHEFLPDTVLEMNWVRTRGHKLFRAQQVNRVPGNNMDDGTVYVDRMGRTLTGVGARRLNPNYGTLRVWQNVTESWYDGLQTTVRKAMSHGFMMNANYTWAHSLDTGSDWHSGAVSANGSAAGDGFSLDQTATFLDKANSTFDVRHRFVINFLWETPWHSDQQGLKGHLLGGWQFNGIFSAQTGAHWTAYCTSSYSDGCDFNADGERNDRPDITTGNSISGNTDRFANGYFASGGCAFSTDPSGLCTDGSQPFFVDPCFSINAANGGVPGLCAENGNLGRNTFVGPTHVNADFSIFKNIRIKESLALQIRLESYNLFNHANWNLPNGAPGGNKANRITSSSFGQSDGTLDPRSFQLGLRLTW